MSTSVESLAEPLRSAVRDLLTRAKTDGKDVAIASGRRSRTEQIALRRAHCGTSDYDIFEKDSMACTPPTAKPGESAHERGNAVDFAGDLDYVAEVAGAFDLVRTVPGEFWHYEHAATARGGPSGDPSPFDRKRGIGVGDIPIVGGALEGGKDAVAAGADFARALVDPKTWICALGLIGGMAAVAIGLGLIARDLGVSVPMAPTVRLGRNVRRGDATTASSAAQDASAAVAA